jgi:hypothetical protein
MRAHAQVRELEIQCPQVSGVRIWFGSRTPAHNDHFSEVEKSESPRAVSATSGILFRVPPGGQVKKVWREHLETPPGVIRRISRLKDDIEIN